nr:nucleotide-binding alpha-beta plait domain-containing protein [Tanacetum cinerariifolium]
MKGKRFGFVRFINIFNQERLVNNLCTVWINRHKLQANVARFQRYPVGDKAVGKEGIGANKSQNHSIPKVSTKVNNSTWGDKSYMGAVKGVNKDVGGDLVVKEFASLANIQVAIGNEGFTEIKIKYMGELWVMMEFTSKESLNMFRENISIASWFSQIKTTTIDFETDGRIAWVEIEGVPFKLWSRNTFKRIAKKWGRLLDVDDQEEMCYHSKWICIYMKSGRNVVEEFKIIHRGKSYWIRANETPGWVSDFSDDSEEDDQDELNSKDEDCNNHNSRGAGNDSDVEGVPDKVFEEGEEIKGKAEDDNRDFAGDRSEDPFNLYPLLNKVRTTVDKSGSFKYPPGFTPSNSVNGVNFSHVVEEHSSCDDATVNGDREGVNDNASGSRTYNNVKDIGNESVSSGHLKNQKSLEQMLMIITVYAPQDCKDKQMLWDFLQHEIRKCKGETIIKDDFNEVGFRSDRKNIKARYLKDLADVDSRIDSGQMIEGDICNRADIILKLQQCDKIDSMEMRRNILNIRGILVDGVWVDSPNNVKKEFYDHFRHRFSMPGVRQATLLMDFPNQLQPAQRKELEIEVNNDEIKRAVLECGTDKAPDEGLFHGIKLHETVKLSHMFYADDVVFGGQWSDSNITTKATWVSWSKVLTPKAKGGLGVSSLFALNRGLLFKWVWRFLNHGTSLWARVIKAIHGADGNIGADVKGSSNSCWLTIVKEIKILSTKGINLMNYMRIRVGNGENTSLWEDNWRDDGILKDRFPRIFALESCESISVGSKYAQPSFHHSFRR